jgi:hypothetical protein
VKNCMDVLRECSGAHAARWHWNCSDLGGAAMKADISLAERRRIERDQWARFAPCAAPSPLRCHARADGNRRGTGAAGARSPHWIRACNLCRDGAHGGSRACTCGVPDPEPAPPPAPVPLVAPRRRTCPLIFATISDCDNHNGEHPRPSTPHQADSEKRKPGTVPVHALVRLV